MRRVIALLVLTVIAPEGLAGTAAASIIGWVEHVRVFPGDVELKAKIDTGADATSLHCVCLAPVERDGEKWVSFTVENDAGDKVRLERKVHRIAKIKRHYGEAQERMVIMLGLCVGNTYRQTEVNLVDRSGFEYPLLVGRKFLAGDFLVDASATFLIEPDCKDVPTE